MNEWRKIQRENFTSLDALCKYLELDVLKQKELHFNSEFPLNLPKRLALKIQKNTLNDPILRQFVPLKEEQHHQDGFSFNPVGDIQAGKTPKCLQKYQARVLFLPTSACAMHCRFCFRKNFPYDVSKSDFSEEIALIAHDESINEVILSGGDPLSLSNSVLEKLIRDIASLSHIKRLRFHTRFPIGIPERIDDSLLAILQNCPLQTWFIIHCNHALELDADVLHSLKKIQKLGIPVLSQTVLLKGVNDALETLKSLFEKLVDAGIVPYYLHQLDKVFGSKHFEVLEEQGLFLMEQLKDKLSGYALPRYVKEICGESAKTLISRKGK